MVVRALQPTTENGILTITLVVRVVGREPDDWNVQLTRFIRREGLDKRFRKSIFKLSVAVQREFVAQGSLSRKNNPSGAAWARVKKIKNGTAQLVDRAKYRLCRWCGFANAREATACGVCGQDQQ